MARDVQKLATEIQQLSDVDKLQLLDAILEDLDKPDPDRIGADEARKRWRAYKAGNALTVDYETVMAKHRRS
ncbi:MAG TPA: addiction module protein [Terriglobales bacterium]|jgi:hypothetical protein|nr:addiction module protein [Terriglobales bacterium]